MVRLVSSKKAPGEKAADRIRRRAFGVPSPSLEGTDGKAAILPAFIQVFQPIRMEKPTSLFTIAGRSLSVIGRHLFIFVFLALLVAIPEEGLTRLTIAWASDLLSGWLPAHGVIIDPQQSAIVAIYASELPVQIWSAVVGAFVWPAMIQVYLRDDAGQEVSLGDALAFGAARWRQLIVPYALSKAIIWVGLLVVIPGILYGLQYAFVEPVATLENGVKHPLARSRRLTRPVRGRIFRIFLLFIPWWGWYLTIGQLQLLDKSAWISGAASAVNTLVYFAIGLCLLQLYFRRKSEWDEAQARRKAEGAKKTVSEEAMPA
jgi:hypothetical protein